MNGRSFSFSSSFRVPPSSFVVSEEAVEIGRDLFPERFAEIEISRKD
jgi:hypothetical protein